MFSVFDPVTYFGLSINWIVVVILILLVPLMYFKNEGSMEMILEKIMGGVKGMFKEISHPEHEGLVMTSMMLFLFFVCMNVGGLMPFVFPSTGHIVITFSLGLMLWMSGFLMGWMKNFSMSSGHLVPEGSPLFLAPFMVIIESVSQVIRPVTLSVRLAANMMAGHLIIGLISTISLLGFSSFWVSISLQTMMLMLEWAVCFIQAFVFSVLVMLYSLENY